MAAINLQKELALVAVYSRSTVLTSAGLFTTTLLYGIYVVLFTAVMIILGQRGLKGQRLALFAALIVLFILSTFYLCATFSYYIIGLETVLIPNPGTVGILTKNAAYLAKYSKLGVIGQVLFPVATCIGDAIVIWRAYILCGKNIAIMVLPFLLFLGLIGTTFAWIGLFVQAGMPTSIPADVLKLNTALYCVSMALNAVTTAIIGYQVWLHRRGARKYLRNDRREVRAGKILVMLFESGLVYTTLWVIQMAVLVAPSSPDFTDQAFRQVFSGAAAQLVGLYPTCIVILVYLRRSFWDSAGKSTVAVGEIPVEQTFDTANTGGNETYFKPEPGVDVFMNEKGNSRRSPDDSV